MLNLAKYDMNYDIRDRARFLRAIILPQGEQGKISKHAKKIFLASKPPPTIESKFANREDFQLGSLSHTINCRAVGYQVGPSENWKYEMVDPQDLPVFPATPPDPSVRTVEVPKPAENPWRKEQEEGRGKTKRGKESKTKSAKFYESDGSAKMNGNDHESLDSSSSSSSSSGSSSSDSDEETPPPVNKPKPKPETKPSPAKPKPPKARPVESSSSSGSSDDEAPAPPAPTPRSNLDLLLQLEETPPVLPSPVLTPSLGGLLTPSSPAATKPSLGQPMFVELQGKELLNKLVTGGVQVDFRFTRQPHLYSPSMVVLELTFTNLTSEELGEVKLGARTLPPGMAVHEFPAFTG